MNSYELSDVALHHIVASIISIISFSNNRNAVYEYWHGDHTLKIRRRCAVGAVWARPWQRADVNCKYPINIVSLGRRDISAGDVSKVQIRPVWDAHVASMTVTQLGILIWYSPPTTNVSNRPLCRTLHNGQKRTIYSLSKLANFAASI